MKELAGWIALALAIVRTMASAGDSPAKSP
jgi:hypothetical protein